MRNLTVDNSHFSVIQCSIDKVRDFLLGRNGAHPDESTSANGKAPVRRLDARAATITSPPATTPIKYGVLSLVGDNSHQEGSLVVGSSHPRAVGTPRAGGKVRLVPEYPFPVLPRDPKRCTFVHDKIHPGYYRHVERQRRKALSPSDESTMWKQAKKEIAALRIRCFEDQSQRSPATSGRVDGDRPLVREYVDADTDSSNGFGVSGDSTASRAHPHRSIVCYQPRRQRHSFNARVWVCDDPPKV